MARLVVNNKEKVVDIVVAVRHMLLKVRVVQDTDSPIAATDYRMVRPK